MTTATFILWWKCRERRPHLYYYYH